jgi:SAM-dependent methyltransferase/3-polyprenyl-4-hydroxybenzoate decarboxylase
MADAMTWVRSQRAAIAETGDALLLVARDGTVRRLDGDTAELARVVLAYLATPRSEAEIIAHVEALAGPLGERRAVVTELLALLAASAAIGSPPPMTAPQPGLNVVACVTGAIAATHAPALVSALQRRGHTVEVALTETAARFVSVDALAAIAGREIHTSMWPATPHAPAPHISLSSWTALVVVYPASATTIGRIASGDFSDLVSAIALTTKGAVVVAPSMNAAMLETPAVQRNLAALRADGVTVLHGVPSQEVAEAPAARSTITGAAAAPGEVVATIEALRAAGALLRRSPPASWDAAYRSGARPWVRETCDDDIAAALPPPPGRLLDVGCGLGQVARHAAQLGFDVTATDLSEVALAQARELAGSAQITWVRDDVCASNLHGRYDVIVDRATLHTLPRARAHAWAATMRRLLAPGGTLIVKTHRDGVPGVTTGWPADAVRDLLAGFELTVARDAELPGVRSPAPVPSVLCALRRAP